MKSVCFSFVNFKSMVKLMYNREDFMEYLALYDENGKKLSERIERVNKLTLKDGKHFKVVIVFIENKKGEFLIQKVSKQKGSMYATTGGHVQYGASSLETIKSEIEEELGVSIESGYQLYETGKCAKSFVDCYYVKTELDIQSLKLQEEEVESVEWMSREKIKNLIQTHQFRERNILPYYDLLEILKKGPLNQHPRIYKEVI